MLLHQIYAHFTARFSPLARKAVTKSSICNIIALYPKGGGKLKVELKISKEVKEPYAVIYSDSLTDEITSAVMYLENTGKIITGEDNGRIAVLQPSEIYMVRVENERTAIYGEDKKLLSPKRLYQLEQQLGNGFMKISKSTVINLSHIKCVEPSFKGMMSLVMKNGLKDWISRKYLPDFKKYLGI